MGGQAQGPGEGGLLRRAFCGVLLPCCWLPGRLSGGLVLMASLSELQSSLASYGFALEWPSENKVVTWQIN